MCGPLERIIYNNSQVLTVDRRIIDFSDITDEKGFFGGKIE